MNEFEPRNENTVVKVEAEFAACKLKSEEKRYRLVNFRLSNNTTLLVGHIIGMIYKIYKTTTQWKILGHHHDSQGTRRSD